jgi:O-antigen ligase
LSQVQYQSKPDSLVEASRTNTAFYSNRISRWQYAIELWKTEYKLYNKLFGNGFKYYELFGKKFLNDQKNDDYPHNPFISILLYSGIIGLVFYLWFLYKVFSLYLYHRQQYGYLFICFLITFFFSFFSGSSPFDPPIMGFFVLLPFFIHHVHKNNDHDKI